MLCVSLDSQASSPGLAHDRGPGKREQPWEKVSPVSGLVTHTIRWIPHTEVRNVVKQGLVRGSFNSK